MIKREELTNPTSCMSRAKDDEMTFVLLARDIAAPAAIHAWVAQRCVLGKNKLTDPQIVEALGCAREMEKQRREPGKEGDAHETNSIQNGRPDVTRGQSEREQNETGGSSFNEAEERLELLHSPLSRKLEAELADVEAEVQRCIKCREIVEEANDKLEAEVLRLRQLLKDRQ